LAPWWLRSSSDEIPYEDEDEPQLDDTGSWLGPGGDERGDEGEPPTTDIGDELPAEAAGARPRDEAASSWDRGPETPETERAREELPPAEPQTGHPRAGDVEPERVAGAEQAAKLDRAAKADETETEELRRRKRRRRKRRKPSSASPPGESRAADAAAGERPAVSAKPGATANGEGSEKPPGFDNLGKGVAFDLSERSQPAGDERKIAMFCDLENIALGVRDSETTKKFDINLVLERLLEKGKIIVKKAYADWERYSEYKRTFHEAAIELIDIPQKYYSGKNSADIKMVVDAMDLCYSKEHLDTFVVVSGDSDFSPLVSKLKENNKYVIGLGVKNSSSSLLIDNCDEFIYYEDVWRDLQQTPRLSHLSPKDGEVFGVMVDAILALIRENKNILWASMIKQTMQRKRPSFSEGYYGYSNFSELLEDAERKDIIRLARDQRSGNYVVTGFGQKK